MRSTAALMLVVFGVYSSGCSLIFTTGPQPEVQPQSQVHPEPQSQVQQPASCTTSNVAPGFDVGFGVLSVASAVALTVGAAGLHECTPEQKAAGSWCDTWQVWALAGLGAALGALFITSAVVGFNRTAACRASVELKPQQHASTPIPESSFLLVPERGCPSLRDAPRSCSAVALDEARQ